MLAAWGGSRGLMLAASALAVGSSGCWLAVDGDKLFGPETKQVVVEIVYGPGAEPITERSDGSRPFMRAKANFERLFQGTQATVEMPITLDEMRFDPAIVGDDLSIDDAIRFALAGRRHTPSDDTTVIVVVYVPGMLNSVELMWGDTMSYNGVTALAAGSMRRRFGGDIDLEADLEQVVLIHELGHEVGLVNAGLPMAAPHLDDGDGGHHCSNPNCVMHTTSGIATMHLPGFWSDDGMILFGDECLGDIAAVVQATR